MKSPYDWTKNKMKITTIGFDGDDTLWHHENYFKQARDQFQLIMNEIGEFPDATQLADEQHIKNLPLWGYGVKSFTLSMIEAAIAMTKGKIGGNDIKRVIDIGHSLYQHPVILLDHVAETIQKLQGKYRLVLITKGDLVAQEVKIAQSKLGPFFDATEIVSEKDVDTYRKVFKRNHVDPLEFVMVGNSIKSDILPPLQLGANAIHVPYATTWVHETVELDETEKNKFFVLPDVLQLPETLEKMQNL